MIFLARYQWHNPPHFTAEQDLYPLDDQRPGSKFALDFLGIGR